MKLRKSGAKQRWYVVPVAGKEFLAKAASQPRAMKAVMFALGGAVRLATQDDLVRLMSEGAETIYEPEEAQQELDLEQPDQGPAVMALGTAA